MHEAGLGGAGTLVEVARILVKERGEHRMSEEITGASVDKLCGKRLLYPAAPCPYPA